MNKIDWMTAALVMSLLPACTKPQSDLAPGPQATHQLIPVRQDVSARRRALLVGINDYKYDADISDLNGTGNDVEAIRDVLTRRFGFAATDLLILKDNQATKANILAAFRKHLIDGAGPDTIAVFYYSGHGSQMYDTSGDEPDSYDETIVSHDSGRSGTNPNNDISDDELNILLSELSDKTKHATVIMDSCHSGSGVRAAGTVRSAPPDDRQRPVDKRTAPSKPSPNERLADPALAYTLISGARSDEYSYESAVAGKTMGALTAALTRALWAAEKDDTYRDVMAKVASEVTRSFPRQHPQLEGASRDTVLFGLKEFEVEPFLEVSVANSRATLHGGAIHGVTRGSSFSIFAPNTKDFTSSTPLHKAKVVAVEPTTATLESEGPGDIHDLPAGARAIETVHATDRGLLGVYVDPEPVLSVIAKQLAEQSGVAVLDEPSNYALRVRTDDRRNIVIEGGSPGPLVPPIAAGPTAADKVVVNVSKWAKWFALSNLTAESRYGSGRLPVKLTLSNGSKAVRSGEQIEVRVTNDGDSKLYVSLLDLGSDGSISLVYPAIGANEFIDPGNTWKKTVVPCSPQGATEQVRDIVKVIVTTEPHDLSFLTQPGFKRTAAPHPMEELVEQILRGDGTRGASRAERETNTWTTRQAPLLIDPSTHTCAP